MSYGPKQTLQQGFEKFVIKNEIGCWDWKGCAPKNPGYGQFRYEMKLIRAHRASWIIHFGEIPKGMQVLHKCDNRKCSKPDHLFLGTYKDNIHDAIKKGRKIQVKGENHPHAKLNTDQVQQIRKLIDQKINLKEIADQYNVTRPAIVKIQKNINWRVIK